MADPIRVAVVGVGHLGQHHARLYAAAEDAELIGVVDRDADRAAEIAAANGCRVFPDVASLRGEVQAVSVAVPTEHHREVAEPLFDAGLDLLIEKPLARDPGEAAAINGAAKRASRLIMVGHTERFNPAVIALAGAVDAPRFFEIHRLSAFSARSTDIDVVLDLMIHDLDLLAMMDASEVVAVDAVGISALTDRVDIANARIRLASGCVANLTASRISAEPVRRVRVFQSRTYLSCDTGKREVERYRLVRGEAGAPTIRHDHLPVQEGEPLALELAAFLESVRTRRCPVDGNAGARAVVLAHRVLEAIGDSPSP